MNIVILLIIMNTPKLWTVGVKYYYSYRKINQIFNYSANYIYELQRLPNLERYKVM